MQIVNQVQSNCIHNQKLFEYQVDNISTDALQGKFNYTCNNSMMQGCRVFEEILYNLRSHSEIVEMFI